MIPFEVRVFGRNTGAALIQNGWPSHIISIVDTGQSHLVPLVSRNHLRMEFDDVEDQREDEFVAPAEEHVLAALTHAADLKAGDRLLVHCNMGVSRSPAIAIGILMQHGASYASAYDQIAALAAAQQRPMRPNRMILSLLDEHFQTGGALRSYHQQKMRERAAQPVSGGAAEMQRIMDLFRNGG